MSGPGRTRRGFAQLLAAMVPLVWARGVAGQVAVPPPRDRGIGGTGARLDDDGDRGIGGTGVIGTLRGFGSIIVNGLRIGYPADVAVEIDGMPARASDLRVGQIVRAVATAGPGGALSTRRITVESEVVGRIERLDGTRLVVLGQTVEAGDLGAGRRLGERIAVSGQRRRDGVIEASLIENRDSGPDRVAGPVVAAPAGLAIGGLNLLGIGPGLAGRRAVVEGTMQPDGFRASRAADDAAPFAGRVSAFSIEGFAERVGGGLRLGSGLAVSGAPVGLPRNGSTLAVVGARSGPGGMPRAESVRASRPGQGPSGRSPERGEGPGPGGGPGAGGPGQRGPGPGGLSRGSPGAPPTGGRPGGFSPGFGGPDGRGAPSGRIEPGGGFGGGPGGIPGFGGGSGPGGGFGGGGGPMGGGGPGRR